MAPLASPPATAIVVGAPNSSNSQRLREVAEREGCKLSVLAQRASDIDLTQFEGVRSIGLTAGASAPEVLVTEIIDAFRAHYDFVLMKDAPKKKARSRK